MLSFEEDFQDVCILPPPLTQKSQSGAEFFSHFFSILFKAGLYLYYNTKRYFSIFLFAFSFHMAIMLERMKESNIVQD